MLYVPFVIWNAEHHWTSFVFAFQQRHVAEPRWYRPFTYLLANAGAYSPGLWIAALLVLVRPRNALIAWTSIPLSALLILLNFHERIELHWFFGPYVSLAVGMGVAFEELSHRARVLWATAGAVPAAVLDPVPVPRRGVSRPALLAVPRDGLRRCATAGRSRSSRTGPSRRTCGGWPTRTTRWW